MKLGSYFILLAGVARAANFAKCPTIEAVDNEKKAGPICEDDACVRQCKKGFVPMEPTQVLCIKKPNGKFKWDGELGACQAEGSDDDKPTDDKPDADYGDKPDGDYADKPDDEWDGDWGDKPDGDYGDKPDDGNDDKPTDDKPTDEKPEEEKPEEEPVDFASLTDNPGCKEVELKAGQVKKGMSVSYKLNGKGQFMATLACQEGQTVNGKEGVDKKKLFCKCNKKSGKCKWKNEANKKVSKAKYQKWKCEGDPIEKPEEEKPVDETGGKPDEETEDKPDGDYGDKPDGDWDGDWGDKPDGETGGNDDKPDGGNTGGSTGGGNEVIPQSTGLPKILALHGGDGNGAIFAGQQGMQDLMNALGSNFEFYFPSAPENGVWMRDPPGGKPGEGGSATTDPAWADVALNYLDEFIAEHGPFAAMMGYSQGAAFIPVYLSNRPETSQQFMSVAMYCGFAPSSHEGLMATINQNTPLGTNAMVFSGASDPFAFGAPEQIAMFDNVVAYESSEAGHHLPYSNDPEFQNTLDFFLAIPRP